MLAAVILILAIPIALVTTTIRVVISEQAIYDRSVREYNAAAVSGIPEDELIRANGQIRDYLLRPDPGPLSIEVQDRTGENGPLFTARETVHMADVRDLVQAMFVVQVVSVVVVLAFVVLMAVLWPPRALAAALLHGSVLTVGLIGAAAALAFTGFDAAWSQFHGIAFSNDLWQLDPDRDHLIQMYPEEFWFEVTTLIGGAIAVQALLIASLASVYLFLTREPAAEETGHRTAIEPRPEHQRLEVPGRAGHAHVPRQDARHSAR
jgi:integral membrane protein (TIGR01906 family)